MESVDSRANEYIRALDQSFPKCCCRFILQHREYPIEFCSRLRTYVPISSDSWFCDAMLHLKLLYCARGERAKSIGLIARGPGTTRCDARRAIRIEKPLKCADVFPYRADCKVSYERCSSHTRRCRRRSIKRILDSDSRKHTPDIGVLPAVEFENRNAANP